MGADTVAVDTEASVGTTLLSVGADGDDVTDLLATLITGSDVVTVATDSLVPTAIGRLTAADVAIGTARVVSFATGPVTTEATETADTEVGAGDGVDIEAIAGELTVLVTTELVGGSGMAVDLDFFLVTMILGDTDGLGGSVFLSIFPA